MLAATVTFLSGPLSPGAPLARPDREDASGSGSVSSPAVNRDPAIDWRNHVAAALVDRAISSGLVNTSDRTALLDELELLITDDRDLKPYVLINGNYVSDPNPAAHNKRDGLIYCLNDALCPSSRTADVVKGACTAVLGSAAVMIQ